MQTVAAYAGMAICARKLPSGRRPPRRCRATLDALLVRGERATTTPFNRLKQTPASAAAGRGPPCESASNSDADRLRKPIN